jgi:hypothetical protein
MPTGLKIAHVFEKANYDFGGILASDGVAKT